MKDTIVISGNHLTPALALAEKLTGYRVIYLWKKIPSPRFSRHRPLISLLSLVKLPFGLIKARALLLKYRPVLVLSFGCYSAVPVGLAAVSLKIPLVLHEQTMKAGLANRLLAPLALKIAVSWPQSQNYFPRHKVVLTGNPIRSQLLKAAKKHLTSTISHQPSIYITGGNQGSRTINLVLTPLLPRLLARYRVIHQFGLNQSRSDWNKQVRFKAGLPRKLVQNYRLKRWFETGEVGQILNRADLVVSRAGINTVVELALFGKKAVLIPHPKAQKNEQQQNALFLKKHFGARVIEQNRLTREKLLDAITMMLKTKPHRPSTIYQLPASFITDGADRLYQLVKSVCEKA